MTKRTFNKGMIVFYTTFSNIKSNEKTRKVWFMLLQDISDEAFLFAVTKICREIKSFYPTDNFAAMIRDQITVNMDDEALLAWQATKNSMALKGAYCSVKFSDPIIHSVVLLMASDWETFCHLPMDKWIQKDFVDNYKILAKRNKHPEYLKGIHEIENTANGYIEYVKPPQLIETGTAKYKVFDKKVNAEERKVLKLAQSLTDKMTIKDEKGKY